MLSLLSMLQKKLIWAVPIVMASGLALGYLMDATMLKALIFPATFVMVFSMMVALNVRSAFKYHDTKLQIITHAVNFILLLFFAYVTGKILFSGEVEKYGVWAVGLFLMGVLSASGMTVSCDDMPETDVVALKPVETISRGLVPDIRKILYATDLSQTARHAARYVCSLGCRYGAEVHVVHVIQDVLGALSDEAGVSFADMIEHDDWDSFQEESLEKAKLAINQRICEASQDVKKEIPLCPFSENRVSVEVGDPVQTILSVAEKGRFDLIVLGTRGHGKLESATLGSVARDIVKKSLVPVMVVRPQEAKPARRSAEGFNKKTSLQALAGS